MVFKLSMMQGRSTSLAASGTRSTRTIPWRPSAGDSQGTAQCCGSTATLGNTALGSRNFTQHVQVAQHHLRTGRGAWTGAQCCSLTVQLNGEPVLQVDIPGLHCSPHSGGIFLTKELFRSGCASSKNDQRLLPNLPSFKHLPSTRWTATAGATVSCNLLPTPR